MRKIIEDDGLCHPSSAPLEAGGAPRAADATTPAPRGGAPRRARRPAKKKACDDAKADAKAPKLEHAKAPKQTENEASAPPAVSLLSKAPAVVLEARPKG